MLGMNQWKLDRLPCLAVRDRAGFTGNDYLRTFGQRRALFENDDSALDSTLYHHAIIFG